MSNPSFSPGRGTRAVLRVTVPAVYGPTYTGSGSLENDSWSATPVATLGGSNTGSYIP
jgi:hypothetical protein